eukprot:CAMPEP_0202109814 /NCGR_PEP_ID=MMETSP0965-20130614/24852_1 /ASSEMBLY_ACC=CAM_ASM_000507 /TAXON_ID=4773 /ORGANISM="Schizochytrium aggregatum, Strain ATCC28209" /LENGTH=45 /DNA_ID= /DNA_START= /DNA_END= /DNA_ORIENTATION=
MTSRQRGDAFRDEQVEVADDAVLHCARVLAPQLLEHLRNVLVVVV